MTFKALDEKRPVFMPSVGGECDWLKWSISKLKSIRLGYKLSELNFLTWIWRKEISEPQCYDSARLFFFSTLLYKSSSRVNHSGYVFRLTNSTVIMFRSNKCWVFFHQCSRDIGTEVGKKARRWSVLYQMGKMRQMTQNSIIQAIFCLCRPLRFPSLGEY